MGYRVGVWIDRTKAVVVSASAGRVTKKTLASDVGPQARCGQHLDGFSDQIIGEMGQPEAMVIFGPDEAKLRLSGGSADPPAWPPASSGSPPPPCSPIRRSSRR